MITIAEASEKCKSLVSRAPRDVLVLAVLVLASSLSFGLGYLAGLDAGLPVQAGQGILESPITATTTGQVVASKSGTKYYFPSCAGVERISDANKVWFVSVDSAKAAGYAPAANCKGL